MKSCVGGLVWSVPKPQPHPNTMRRGSRERGAIPGNQASSSSAGDAAFFLARGENEDVCSADAKHVDDEVVLGTPEMMQGMLHEEESDSQAPQQLTARRAEDHRERLVMHPGWTLKAPPMLDRWLIPNWGGPEALVHQQLQSSLKNDMWYVDRIRGGVLTRFHAVLRQTLCVPSQQGVPAGIQWADLTGRQRRLAICAPIKVAESLEDRFDVRAPKPGRNLEMPREATSWTGLTEFELSETVQTPNAE